MRSLKESILDDDKDVKKDIRLNSRIMLAHELAKRGKSPKTVEDGVVIDMFGRELHVGDIVLTNGAYATNIIEPHVIVEIGYDKKYDMLYTIDYDPYSKKKTKVSAIQGWAANFMKLIDPEKYLK